MAASTNLVKDWFPHVKLPVICSAPMRLVAGVDLVCAVTKAGGLGFFGAGYDISSLDRDLTRIRQNLNLASDHDDDDDGPLPIGVGFISHSIDFKPAFDIVQKHKVQAVWLSFPTSESNEETLKTEKEWIDNLKKLETQCRVFVQVGSVKGAQRAVEGGASVIVTQASDAGGHGWVLGAGITTLVPEVCDYLEEKGLRDQIPVLATGGIMDGRGLVAALGLGASGVVMGTRFVACTESMAHDNMKAKLVATQDGGQNTVRSRFFDQLRGTEDIWPEDYNGRGITNNSWHEIHGCTSSDVNQTQTRRSQDEVKQLFKKAEKEHDYDRGIVFAGTGVGLINEVLSASAIIEQTHTVARRSIEILQKMLV